MLDSVRFPISTVQQDPLQALLLAPSLKTGITGQELADLMGVFWEGAQVMPSEGIPTASTFAGKAAALVSPNYRRVFQATLAEGRLPEEYCRLQLVTDYICGMTDSFATNLHSDLFNGR